MSHPAFFRDETAFLDALKQRHTGAVGYFFDRYHRRVDRTLCAVLGPDAEIPDLVQEVFTRALASIPRFRGDFAQLEGWITRIAVYTARTQIRRRRTARRWTSQAPAEESSVADPQASPEIVDALRRAYTLIERLPVKERIPFVLRTMDQMKLEEVAATCEISLATTKRRLKSARARLDRHAQSDPVLVDWLRRGPSS
ncbi:MAG: RNA polymerase sigma factor [Myxococcota bacterium]